MIYLFKRTFLFHQIKKKIVILQGLIVRVCTKGDGKVLNGRNESDSFAIPSSSSRSSRSELINQIKNGPDYPFLGLKYVTEYINPGNPNKDPMYSCSLEGDAKKYINVFIFNRFNSS